MSSQEITVDDMRRAGGTVIGNVGNAVIKFTEVKDFTTFLAEYAIQDDNYIIHFFPPKERYVFAHGKHQVHGPFLVKWQRTFPQVLDPTAQEYFGATAPRLQAAYTAEMFSWWFKAAGFASRLGPDEYLLRFFEKLDAALDAASFLA